MDKFLDKKTVKKEIFSPKKIYKQSRIGYFGYYLLSLAFLFLAFYIKWTDVFRYICFGIFFVFLLFLEIVIIRNHLIVDDKKVEMQTGIFNIIRKSIPLQMISDTRIKQNFLQSLLHYGNFEVNTGGGEFYELKMEKLRNPGKVKEDIENRLYNMELEKK